MDTFEKKKEDEQLNRGVHLFVKTGFDAMTEPISFIFHMMHVRIIAPKKSILNIVLICVAIFFIVFVWNIFIEQPLLIGKRRFFLENSIEDGQTRVGIIGYAFLEKRIWNTSFIMLCKNIQLFLWSLTIVGGMIKSYEYRAIPYILAENPYIKRKDAFLLAKQTMKGYKWQFFLLDLSFILWDLLSFVTFGIAGCFFVSPYKSAAKTEAFREIRQDAIRRKVKGYEHYNDTLFDLNADKQSPASSVQRTKRWV